MSLARRQGELETLVDLLFEVVPHVPSSRQHDVRAMARLLQLALPSLLHFA